MGVFCLNFQIFKFSNFQIGSTHSQCVFSDPTQQQGASKLQARKHPKFTPTLIVYLPSKSFCNFATLQVRKFANLKIRLSFPKISRQFFDYFTK